MNKNVENTYEKTQWVNGQILSAEKLNKIEDELIIPWITSVTIKRTIETTTVQNSK